MIFTLGRLAGKPSSCRMLASLDVLLDLIKKLRENRGKKWCDLTCHPWFLGWKRTGGVDVLPVEGSTSPSIKRRFFRRREIMTVPSTTSGSSSSTIWLVVALLWPVALLNYLDRQMLAAMKASVMVDIPSISNAENWGYMLGQFKWVYAFMSPLGGYVADRFSRRFMICVSLAVWSAVTLATGYVTTYDGLLFTRTLMGISEAFYFPACWR